MESDFNWGRTQNYELVRRSGGESSSLCRYQMDTTNTQHSDLIALDMSSGTGRVRDPDIEIHAHHGYLTVSFNGRRICHVKDTAFTEGFFTLENTPAISAFTIELNAGSAPVFAPASALVDIRSGTEPLEPREGARYEAYNAFVADYNAFLTVMGGGELPETFQNSYFNLFFGKAESDAAYEAIRRSTNMDDYLAYLKAFPFNAHKAQIEKTLYALARKADTVAAYRKFETAYPDSTVRLEVKKHAADLQWRDTVKKPTRKALDKYLEVHPDGYYARRARLLLEGLDYYAAHKAEVDEARKILAQAQTLVAKSPVTAPWDVAIVDYQSGSVYFNLNNGPVIAKGSDASEVLFFVTHQQTEAHRATCELLDNRISAIDFCLMLFSRDYVSPHAPFSEAEAIQDALKKFYLSRMERGETVNMTRVIELLDRMAELEGEGESPQTLFMVQTYAQLGMYSEAAHRFSRYALATKPRDQIAGWAERLRKDSPGLAQTEDFRWLASRLGL